MWVPRIVVASWAWFAVGYLVLIILSVAALIAMLMRLQTPRHEITWWVATCSSASVSLFMWLVGAPVWFALLLGAGIIPVVLVVFGETSAPPAGDCDRDG